MCSDSLRLESEAPTALMQTSLGRVEGTAAMLTLLSSLDSLVHHTVVVIVLMTALQFVLLLECRGSGAVTYPDICKDSDIFWISRILPEDPMQQGEVWDQFLQLTKRVLRHFVK
eukprot:c5039_g1_i3.p1 GENE.c5039_g1_i3~~c5039_g1_i3.p1  ORF type:complete len:114 (-),score=22.89 c5039_g1_i3:30-371(-)